MYAVIETGGKQYMVEQGTVIRVEKLGAEAGSEITFDKVVMVGGDGAPSVGTPWVEGAAVKGTVVAEGRDRKIVVYHKKRRKGHEKKTGHRQPFTDVKITAISS